ncbi:MAG TPA: polysaccharide biosynthesis/export family protein [Rickettsiales bacterium]|nr:polysaccharide biosynthesis/export family protein [Rickettsiales bacterium]
MSISTFSTVKYLVAGVACVVLSGCITQPQAPNLPAAPASYSLAQLPMAKPQPYHFQVGDVMDIKVLMSPELNDQVVVRPDGMISTTIAHDVQAYGKTPAELREELENVYSKQLLNPQVSVILRSFAPERIYVTGEVNTPGEFVTVGPELTLLQAIARAGGVKNDASTDLIILRRGQGDKPIAYAANYLAAVSGKDPASDVRLAPFDVVYVPRSGVGNAYLYFQQYVQQFVPVSFGLNYQINPTTTVNH